MNRLGDISIRWKLTLISALTSAVVLVLAGAGLVTYELLVFRPTVISRIISLAEFIAANSAYTIVYHDPKTAQRTLSTLEDRRDFVCAALYDADGKLFASAKRPRRNVPQSVNPARLPSDHFQGRELALYRPIMSGDDLAGVILLRVNLEEERNRRNLYIGVVGFLTCALLLLALYLGARLQRIVSDPVLDLARVTEQVTSRKDYSLRARKRSRDEIGRLVDGFNQMLVQIQQRDSTLRESEERFRQIAESIHEVFWMTDASKQRMIYVSPGYEEVWGRTCDSLYAAPQDWLEAIHPDDRERVRQASLTRQVTGQYDEIFRIVQPSGVIRWIRDRAFPVADAAGAVTRIVGIAEDITERKQLEREVLEISSAEQRRIGHDLHDGLGQHLTGIALKAKLLEDTLHRAKAETTDQAREIVSLVNHAIGQTRSLARGLDPIHVESEGLVPALDQLAADTERFFFVPCSFKAPEAPLRLDRFASLQLYLTASEAVTNAIRHGRPGHIEIEVQVNNAQIVLLVNDDGTGFVPGLHSGLGLRIMQYRAQSIGAMLQIHSQPKAGTQVVCTLPVPPDNTPAQTADSAAHESTDT